MAEQHKYPYDVTEEPPELSEKNLCFMSQYTGEKDVDSMRARVLSVWRAAKSKVPSKGTLQLQPISQMTIIFSFLCCHFQVWTYGCIQKMSYLQPRITQHEYYPNIRAAIKSGIPLRFLVGVTSLVSQWYQMPVSMLLTSTPACRTWAPASGRTRGSC